MQLEKLAIRSTNSEQIAAFQQVLSEYVKPNWQTGPWVAGGCIRRLLLGDDPFESDVDVFFASETQKEEWVVRIKAMYPQAVSLANANNITIDCGEVLGVKRLKLQAVHVAYYETPQAVIDSFDYTICQLVTDGQTLENGEFTLWDLARKRLVLHKLEYPVPTMRRMIKYAKQGFYACPGMMNDLLTRVLQNPRLIDSEILYID
ncbi:MAG: hypothetical protein MN733_06425 [Nitrososphaera sp.]|nr:hypothetical protein [Nitrososphaera sp.]